MITAHLPSGYIIGKLAPAAPLVFPAAVIGGVLPDSDLVWFYLVDDRAIHHHRYWVHIPGFWLAIAVVSLPIVKILSKDHLPAALTFFVALLVHLILDTIGGGILWLWPVSNELFALVTVTPRFDIWILNFIVHPVFALEILIWVWAIALFRRSNA